MPSPHFATVGYYDDGTVGEIFLDSKKMATDVANLARDCALILSIALQYSVPIEEMRASVGRTEDGLPHTVIGSALDLLAGEQPIDPIPTGDDDGTNGGAAGAVQDAGISGSEGEMPLVQGADAAVAEAGGAQELSR